MRSRADHYSSKASWLKHCVNFRNGTTTPRFRRKIKKFCTICSARFPARVIYSREHWLAPPYVVTPGDTLETVAQQYQVPWQLLAKINGIDKPNGVIPGEKLKVVRGPFQAQLNRQRDTITLFADGLYAGRFKVQGEREVD